MHFSLLVSHSIFHPSVGNPRHSTKSTAVATYHASLTCTVAICTLFMNVVDNAIYPHLCADYFLQVLFPLVYFAPFFSV